MMKNYYTVLELEDFVPLEEVKRAYRRLARKYHPDLNDGDKEYEEKFKEIQEAYEHLETVEKKAAYDALLVGREEKGEEETYSYTHRYTYYTAAPSYDHRKRRFYYGGGVFGCLVFLMIKSWLIDDSIYYPLREAPKVTIYHNTDTARTIMEMYLDSTPVIKDIAPKYDANKPSFSIGSSREQVVAAAGQPEGLVKYAEFETWSYGNSTVVFKNGRVATYAIIDTNLNIAPLNN